MHDHVHHKEGTNHLKPLIWALLITFAFAIVEAVGGWLSGSLALLSDAGHMVTDVAALALGAIAAALARKPAGQQLSFGWGRAEVLAAIINVLFMLAIITGIGYAAIARLQAPQPVNGTLVMLIAAIGLIINIGVAWVLHRGEQTLNIRGALLHVVGDLLGSVGALIAGAVIWLTGWTLIDPILSLVICLLILVSALRLLRDAIHVLIEGVPRELDLPHVGKSMATVDGVRSVHDLHIWRLDSSTISLSAHVVVDDLRAWPGVLVGLREILIQHFGIEHITLQPEPIELARVAVTDIELPGKKGA
ncbi:MAG TPA: cation diffusion facilitator family transporter [Gammaproteobacteria bacterium]|nr:cation diffusion facilitator family transporter [Gammaproteobacteria bacterium]